MVRVWNDSKKNITFLPKAKSNQNQRMDTNGALRFVEKRIQGVHLGNNAGIIIPQNPNQRKTKQNQRKPNKNKTYPPTNQPTNQTETENLSNPRVARSLYEAVVGENVGLQTSCNHFLKIAVVFGDWNNGDHVDTGKSTTT